MNNRLVFRYALIVCALCLLLVGTSSAQRMLGSRTFVPSPQALGMGNAVTAYPSPQTAIFYNPAQLTFLKNTRAPITMLGMSAAISKNLPEHLDFFQKEVRPAIDNGIENLSPEEEAVLYNEMLRLGSTPALVSGDILLPSFALNRESYGIGGGIYIHGDVVYEVDDAGAGVPGVEFSSLADVMFVASGAFKIFNSLSVGVTGEYVQRYVSLKSKPIDAFDEDESIYILGASSLGMDVGLLYEMKLGALPGRLFLGMAANDLTFADFDYKFSAYYVKNEEVQNDQAINSEIAVAQQRYQLNSSFRAGAAYVIPQLAGPLKETAVTLDYININDPVRSQPLLGRLSLGFQTTLGKVLALRTGLNQGYTTVGAGLQFSFARIDYAYYGTENGLVPGQSPGWHHRVMISLGSF